MRAAALQAGLEYNPKIRELREQAKGSAFRQGQIGDWYSQLANDYAQSQAAGQQAFQSAENATAQQLTEAAQRSKGNLTDLANRDEAFAKLVGGPTNSSGLQQAAQAGAAAERSRVALNAPIAAEQADYLANLGSRRTAARMRGVEAQGEERRRREKILSEIGAARSEKGAAIVSGANKLREAQRQAAMEQENLALKRQEAAVQAQQANAQLALDRAKLAQSVREGRISATQAQQKLGIDAATAAAEAPYYRARARYYAQGGSEAKTAKRHMQNAFVEAQNLYRAAKKPPRTAADWAAFSHLVAEQSEIDPVDARKAVQALQGRIVQHQARQRRKVGGFKPFTIPLYTK